MQPEPKASSKPRVMGSSSVKCLESGSVKKPESIPENQEVIDLTFDKSKRTCINKKSKHRKETNNNKSKFSGD